MFFFFRQRTAYEVRIIDCMSDVCSSYLNDVGVWLKIAFTPQPQRVRFPMLFQAADNEFLGMVGSHTALRQIGTPSDLYIFPNEDHIKSQPAHRLALYRRNLAWFNFWLKDEVAQDPAQKEEVARWVKMRDEDRKSVVWGKSVSVS